MICTYLGSIKKLIKNISQFIAISIKILLVDSLRNDIQTTRTSCQLRQNHGQESNLIYYNPVFYMKPHKTQKT